MMVSLLFLHFIIRKMKKIPDKPCRKCDFFMVARLFFLLFLISYVKKEDFYSCQISSAPRHLLPVLCGAHLLILSEFLVKYVYIFISHFCRDLIYFQIRPHQQFLCLFNPDLIQINLKTAGTFLQEQLSQIGTAVPENLTQILQA